MLFILNVGMSLSMESANALFPLYIQSLGASILEVGLLLSAAGLFATALMIPSGWMSDRFGRKPTLLLSVALSSFPPFFYTFAAKWDQLIPWAIIFSAGFAVFIPARMVYIAESTDSESRTKMYGYMNLAWPIGSLIGPMAAGLLAEMWSFHYPFYLAAILSLFSLIPGIFLVERQPSKRSALVLTTPTTKSARFSRETIWLLVILTAYQLLVSAGIGTTYSLLSIYLSTIFKADMVHIGLFFSLMGFSLFGSQILGGWASGQFGLKKTIGVCLASLPPLLIISSLAPDFGFFTITFVAVYSVYSMTWPASVSILMGLVDRSRWGLATGIRQTGVRLGFTIGPTLGGVLWQTYGPTASFYASALLIALSIPFLIELKEE